MSDLVADSEIWRCGVCATENGGGAAGDASGMCCWACGREKPRIDWARRLRRLGAIAMGIALQAGAGVLIWLYPPGMSAWSWALYLAMGIVGFLHIFIGGEMLRRDSRSANDEAREVVFTAAMLPHPTGEPATLAPGEMRLSGAAIVAVVVAMAVASCAMIWMIGGP